MSDKKLRTIRSFVLRQGRLTNAQQNALDNYWKDYGVDYNEELLDFGNLFNNKNPVTLEIGFGNGDSLLEQAIASPEQNFLGIEVHRPGVGHLLNRIQQNELTNLRVMNHDAVEILNNQVPDCSINCVQLFFPDPWHKKKHHKRRILQKTFIETIHNKLVNGGKFHMATDWQHYAEHMLNEMTAANGFINDAGAGNYSGNRTGRPQTKFEHRGIKLGHDVWDLVFTKKD